MTDGPDGARPPGEDGGNTEGAKWVLKGKVWVFEDDVNTDVIFPGRYLHIFEPEEMAEHAMEDADPEFKDKLQQGDIVVAGRNFGCGSSREQAATCLKHIGVGAVVASSFARLYYRNAINQGLPIMVCPDSPAAFGAGDEVELDLREGVVRNLTRGTEHRGQPLPEFMLGILEDGGLVPNLKKRLGLE